VLLVTKLDRLARSTLDLLRIIELIGKEGAGFKSLGDPWADTTTRTIPRTPNGPTCAFIASRAT
jgi:DNA invertase Pin-like site-specific DNA recombinase